MPSDYRNLSRDELIRLLEVGPAGEAERYRNLMEQAADGIFVADQNGVYLDVNESGARMLGWTRAEVIGRRITDIVVAEEVARVAPELDELQRGQTVVREWVFKRKDGSTFPGEVSAKQLADGRVQGIVRDITLRRQSEATLRQREDRFRQLTAATFEGIGISERGRVVDVNDQLARMLGYTREEIIGQQVEIMVAPESREHVAAAMKSARQEPYEHLALRKDGTTFPVEVQAKVIDWRGQRVRVTAIRDISERKRVESAVRESEAQFRAIFENAAIGVSLADLTGRLVKSNPALQRLLGYTEAELQGLTFVELTHPEDREPDLKLYRSLVAGERADYQIEKRYLRRDGQPVWVRLTVSLVHPTNSHPQYAIGMIEDITERKSAATALRKSEEKFAKAFRASADAIGITDLATGRYIEANDSYSRVFGYTREEVVGRTSLELGLWENATDRQRLTVELQQHGRVREFLARGNNRWGEQLHCLISAEIIEVDGRPCIVSVVHDITARMQTEAALRASEESLRATIENTPHVAVQWYDTDGCVVFWNQASERIYGWTAAEAMGQTLDHLMLTAAETADFVKTLGQVAQTGQAVGPVEIPFRRRDGSPGVSLSTIFRIPAASGVLRFVCMDVDVTARIAAEESLRQAQARELGAREEFARHLLNAQEDERRRIASELHDSLGQNLLLIKNYAQLALTQADNAAAVRQQLASIDNAAVQAIAEVRQISHDLRPYQLDQLGLTGALTAMIERAAQSAGIVIDHKLESVDDAWTATEAVNVYRIVQESVNNILKHSGAKRARIELERDVRDARVRIQDAGCGFDVAAPQNRAPQGFGLKNIAERVRILGGTLKLETRPGHGTRLEIAIPIRDGD